MYSITEYVIGEFDVEGRGSSAVGMDPERARIPRVAELLTYSVPMCSMYYPLLPLYTGLQITQLYDLSGSAGALEDINQLTG